MTSRVVLPLSVPLSARDVPLPSGTGAVWVTDAAGRLSLAGATGTHRPVPLPAGLLAAEVSAGADGAVWLLATGARGAGAGPAGRTLLRGDAAGLRGDAAGRFEPVRLPLAAARIAAGPDGTLWIVSAGGEVFARAPDGSVRRRSPAGAPFAAEIAAGPDGSVWVVSTTPRHGGRVVRRLAAGAASWFDLPAPASATKLSVGTDGMAWTVNAQGVVWRLHPAGGGSLAECQVDTACTECRFSAPSDVVHDVSVGAEGTVWVLAGRRGDAPALGWLTDPRARRYQPVPVPGRPVRIAAATPDPLLDPGR